ncbi:MAG: hypothetical protein JOZ19_15405 [Rubrobacter sp.]|nr:hypothetical protein [Rubrobacter sp.]
MTEAEAVQTHLDALNHRITELSENFDADLGRVVPFDYSTKLAAALEQHGISDPHTAWRVFSARAEALAGLRERL